MATDSNSLKRLQFSGDFEIFSTWNTRFMAFMQTTGLYKVLIGNGEIITRRNSHPENTSDEQQAARDAQQRDYTIKVKTERKLQRYFVVLLRTDSRFNNFDDNTAYLCERWWNG